MATIKVKPKQEVEPKDVAGRIIGLLFFLMLAAGIATAVIVIRKRQNMA